MPTGFPAIVPGARFDEVAGPTDGGCGVEEVGSRGEELVGEGKDAGGQRGGDEVNARGTEGTVYLVRRDEIGGGGLGVLNYFGGECLDFHFWSGSKFV